MGENSKQFMTKIIYDLLLVFVIVKRGKVWEYKLKLRVLKGLVNNTEFYFPATYGKVNVLNNKTNVLSCCSQFSVDIA